MNPEKSLGESAVGVLEEGKEAEMRKAHSFDYRSRTHGCIP